MLKKLFALGLVALLGLLAACAAPKVTVTFDSQGGTPVDPQTVDSGSTLVEPEDPTKEGDATTAYTFTGWYTTAAATGEEFTFDTPVTADMTLYAGWTTQVVVRFNTKTSASVPTQYLPSEGGSVSAPTPPTREGYRFGGWFRGKAGLTWLEPQAVSFPLEVTAGLTLFAYWEPLNSKAVNYSDAETYTSSVTEGTSLILNPLTYQWSHEDAFIDMLSTSLYTTEVDWSKAIADGAADYIGDFTKVVDREFSIEAFDYRQIKVGATNFPIDADGNEHLTPEGGYDRLNAPTINSTSWTYNIRQDMKFEDGLAITADTYEYTLKQYLDPQQNNYRSTIFYQDGSETNGAPIVNAAEYRKQVVNNTTVEWSSVGFEKLGPYSFKLTFWKPVSQSAAVGYGNNFRLVHPTRYAASLTNGINSTYGTPDSPYASYGAYVIKSWDENQMLVFNKNYDYVAKETINYKSQVVQIVEDIATQTQLFEQGVLSVLGLSNSNYAAYAEADNLFRSWSGYPQYITMNLAGSRKVENGHEQPEIMFDKRFRQAMLFGFDRNYYASSVYAPNVPSLLPIPSDAKAYLQDPLLFVESPQHLAVLEKHNIDPSTNGYIPERAVQLFDAAYADWLADGNTGPVVLKYVASNSTELNVALANYLESSYELLFNGAGFNPLAPAKFDIQIQWGNQATTSAAQRDWEFDIALLNVGFGSSVGSKWQYPFIAFIGADLGGANLGLSQPYDLSQPLYEDEWVEGNMAEYYTSEITVDLTNTYNYLLEIKDNEDVLPEYLALLEKLEETEDKEAGIYKGTNGWLAFFNVGNTPWDATAAEPFVGATQDIWNMLAAFEDIFLEHVSMIPTVTSADDVVYKSNVVVTWPQYSLAFGWGSNRYRYLNTDADFENGLYNTYKAAFEAQA